jgi:PAS domain S-box-containing protein
MGAEAMSMKPDHSEQLRRSEERFRLLVESVTEYAIFLLDPDGFIASWNKGAERIKGYTESEIIGRHFSVFYGPDAVAARYPQHELELAKREGRCEDEGWRLRKDGSRFWANVLITALRDPAGELWGFAKVTRDMTERRKAEQQLAEARAQLERRTISHRHALEINDNIVQGLVLAKYALDRGDDEAQARALGETLEAARRIVADLLDQTDVDDGGLRRQHAPELIVRGSGERTPSG